MLALLAGPAEAPRAAWQSSYDAAYRLAAAADKPILLCFSNADRPERCPELRGIPADAPFVRVFVNRQSELGRRVFALFQVAGDQACVVIERGLRWQYCRYDRPLSAEEWRLVASTTAAAKGRPEVDPLEPAVAWVPAETRGLTTSAYLPAAASTGTPAPFAEPAAISRPLIEAMPAASPLPPAYPHWLAPRSLQSVS